MSNDESRIINHFDNASKPKDFEKWSTIFRWDENVIEHKKIDEIVCEKQDIPSMQEILHSLIPKCQMLIPIICENLSYKNSLNHCWKQKILSYKKVFWKYQSL